MTRLPIGNRARSSARGALGHPEAASTRRNPAPPQLDCWRRLALRSAAALAASLGVLVAVPVGAQAPAEPLVTVQGSQPGATLRRILELAERNHPNVAAARARLAQVRAQLDEAHFAPYSQLKLTGGVGPAPAIQGTSNYSPQTDASFSSDLGLGWRAGVEGLIPLWTFGKIDNLWSAAHANVRVNAASLEKARDEVRFDVRKAYFGLQLARESLALVVEARRHIDKALARLRARVDDEADPADQLKLEMYAAEVEAKEAEASRYVHVAIAGLRFYTGVPDLAVPETPLVAPRHKLGHVTRYLAAAKLYRPEVAMAAAGVDARTAQVRLARAGLFPDVGLGLSASLSTAPEVADQTNPFVNDAGNYLHYGAAVVFQWNLDLLPQAARIRFAQAQLEEVRAQQRLAMGGVGAEVEGAYATAVDWTKRVDAYARAVGWAKKWLVNVQSGIDVGTLEDKDLLEPAKAYATHKLSLLSATMELDLAMCALAHATGWDAIAPDGG